MTMIVRTGQPLTEIQLYGMQRDGLLVQMTNTAWIQAGVALTPGLRAGALGLPPCHGCVYSHAAAHWVWWGSSQAPALLDVTTIKRRRIRSHPENTAVWEKDLGGSDYRALDGVPVTTPVKTLFDLFTDCIMPMEDERRQRRAARSALAPSMPKHRLQLAELAEDSFRRPGATKLRALLKSIDPGSHVGL